MPLSHRNQSCSFTRRPKKKKKKERKNSSLLKYYDKIFQEQKQLGYIEEADNV